MSLISNPLYSSKWHQANRSIPAWAGQPRGGFLHDHLPAVYPRVGGATRTIAGAKKAPEGLSPRGRGNPGGTGAGGSVAGSIPAWAGQPPGRLCPGCTVPVYPRVGGATADSTSGLHLSHGLSPRGRGNPRHERQLRDKGGSIPAWAGQPEFYRDNNWQDTVYPRVGGATSDDLGTERIVGGLSPRGRGNPLSGCKSRPPARSIPAWAGQPPSARCSCP